MTPPDVQHCNHEECPECGGYGWLPDDEECALCDGTGNRFGIGTTQPLPGGQAGFLADPDRTWGDPC